MPVSKDGRVMLDKPTNEISVLEVEAVQLIASLLCIHDILVDDERRALRVIRDSLTDLAAEWSVSSLVRPEVDGWFLDIPDRPKLAKEVE